MSIFKKILFLLSSQERKQVTFLMFMILIMAILDTIGVASILPFMAVLTNPSLIETNIFLKSIFNTLTKFGVNNNEEFLFILGLIVLLLLIISLSFKALTTYANYDLFICVSIV